ncbi:MAG: putative quinol monooxygenase [Proteobacteria bacterium]|nr:putative quinol monooxygenase [Pseudomonadota bacterium]
MNKFAIFVTIKVKPGKAEAFKQFIMPNAIASVRSEPNCHEFRVLTAKDDPETFHFFEVYTQASDLDSHRQQPHYKVFADGIKDLVLERSIVQLDVLQ